MALLIRPGLVFSSSLNRGLHAGGEASNIGGIFGTPKSGYSQHRITGKMPRARLTFARPPRCVTGVEVVENVDVNGVGVELNG